MKKVLRTAVAAGCAVAALTGAAHIVQASDRPPFLAEELGYDGCTPGFWKNHPAAWAKTFGLGPEASLEATFNVDLPGPDITLLDALKRGGGGFDALGRHAVAGLLNARSVDVDYPLYSYDVVSRVQDAVATGDPEPAHLELANANELGCPTNGR